MRGPGWTGRKISITMDTAEWYDIISVLSNDYSFHVKEGRRLQMAATIRKQLIAQQQQQLKLGE